jgi:hypothetical protein
MRTLVKSMRSPRMEQPPPSAEKQLLVDLLGALHRRCVSAILGVDGRGWPCLTVADHKLVTRQVNASLSLWWFYWGDGHDERVSCHRVEDAADRIAHFVEEGWPERPEPDANAGLPGVLGKYSS